MLSRKLLSREKTPNRQVILITDGEPTAHLDDDTERDIAAMFHSFNQVGVTIVIATPDPSAARDWNARLLTLDHGALTS